MLFSVNSFAHEEEDKLLQAIEHFFPSVPLESFGWHRLSGGYSDAYNYKIDCATCEHSYVIKLHQDTKPLRDVKREFWAFEHASQLGIAPYVYAISLKNKAILTDFQALKTMTLEVAQKPETIHAVATAFRSVHSIPKNPIPKNSVVNRYRHVAQTLLFSPFIDEAMQIVNTSEKKLLKLPSNTATLHGDPNPRNIFIDPAGVKFIDWADTTWDDAFYDLSYFALFMNYDRQQTEILLQSYLGHAPSAEEWKRYQLTEDINLAGFSIILHAFGFYLAAEPLNENEPIQDWGYYADRFANGYEMSPQEIYDWSKAGLKRLEH